MEGLVMGTRSGDIDPGLILHLIQNLEMSAEDVNSLLNYESGLLGLSGISKDVRILEHSAAKGDVNAEFALEYFSYRVSKYIGAYIAALEGVDAIAFSGGIGENSAAIRARICARLSCFGLRLDATQNAVASGKDLACVSSKDSTVSAWIIHANEELQIARDTQALLINDILRRS